MNLIWKLLSKHISKGQLLGFFFANLVGLTIILLGFQFYIDVLPCFTGEDSFMNDDQVVLTKAVRSSSVVSGQTNLFSPDDVEDLRSQPFVESLGVFSSNEYHANATMSIEANTIFNSEVYFESVPDEFVDIDKIQWHFAEGDRVVPVLLPRSYITMYNFGFAKSHSLPTLSDGVLGMVDISLFVQGDGKKEVFTGKLIGFSNKISSILVPQSFMDWTNRNFSSQSHSQPSRILVHFDNPASKEVTSYLEDHGYEVDSDQMNNEKTAYFLKLVVALVMVVGALISALSFYILLLSIFLLVQKNEDKLENLLLIGYTTRSVAWPYQMLTLVLNVGILLVSICAVFILRGYYYDYLLALSPSLDKSSPMLMVALGAGVVLVLSMLNFIVIHNRIQQIWYSKRRNNGVVS